MYEREQERLQTERERVQRQNAIKIAERGKQALLKEKSHGNYLRLLEELDKLENKSDKNWDVESTVTSVEGSPAGPTSLQNSSRAALASSSGSIAFTPRDMRQNEPDFSNSPSHVSLTGITPLQEPNILLKDTQSEVSSPGWLVEEEVPVRDCIDFKATTAPHLPPADNHKLAEIGLLLTQLQKEEHRLLAVDRDNHVVNANVKCTGTISSHSKASSESCDEIVVHSDSELRIACKVTEMKTESPSRRKRRELAKALNAIRKERQALDSLLQNCQPMKPSRLLNRAEPSLPTSATSTPLAEDKLRTCALEEERKTVLKHYVEKLLFMKRQEVKELSVSGSSLSTMSSTPKLRPKSPTSFHVMSTTPEQRSWSKASSATSSAYDTPNTEKSTSVSNASSLPLGAEAATFSNKSEPLPYPLAMDDQIYQAYQQGMGIMGQTGLPLPKRRSVPDQTTESSFMSLTLSASSSEPSKMNNDQRSTLLSSSKSQFSFGLSLSGSLCSHDQTKSTREWDEKFSFTSNTTLSKASSSGTSISKAESSDSSSTNSESISMPDVDAALRRLGLPSMQSVLRR